MNQNIETKLLIIKNIISDNYIILIVMVLVIIISTFITKINTKKKKKNYIINNKKNDPLLENNDFNNIEEKKEIQEKAFDKLKELKIAKMNLDLNTIKNITTNNVYDLYERQINTLIEKNQKNIVQNIKYINSYITNLNSNENEKIINLRIIIECYDYIVYKTKIIKGNINKKVLQTYEVEILNNKINKLQLLYEREI